jgi:glycerophosphoryl diester phosphodiesterase
VIELRRGAGAYARVGHRGASALAPENSLEALELAIELGCDMLEFDVLARRDGTLVLAHERRSVTAASPTLDDALAFCRDRLPDAALQIDLKRGGIEEAVVDSLRREAVLDRSWVSGFAAEALRRIARLEPALPRSYTLPRDRFRSSRRRALLPTQVPALLAEAQASALTLHHSIVSAEAIERAHDSGAAVYVWTVDDPRLAERLLAAGADGIITNDPRIFTALAT